MRTLIIYDNEGYILQQITGSYRVPVGIPYLEVEIPEGKILTGVDTSVTPNTPIYNDNPKSESEITNEKIAKLESENELLKGCVMELANVVYSSETTRVGTETNV